MPDVPAIDETPAAALARKLRLIERLHAENAADWRTSFVALLRRSDWAAPAAEREAA